MNKHDLNNLIQEFEYDFADFTMACNSISFRLFHGDDDLPSATLWIDPPWRIRKIDHFIISSIDCPWHEDYETEEEYKSDFYKWCDLVTHLRNQKPKSITVDLETGDLIIEWKCGTKLEAFLAHNAEETWYFSDYKKKKRYILTPTGIDEKEIKETKRTRSLQGTEYSP